MCGSSPKMWLLMAGVVCLFATTNSARGSVCVHAALSSDERVFLEEKAGSQIAKSYTMVIFLPVEHSQIAL